jgi:hypothetical protein
VRPASAVKAGEATSTQPRARMFAFDRAGHRELQLGHSRERLEHEVEPLVHHAAAAEPEEARARGREVLLVRERVEHGLGDRHRVERLAREAVGRLRGLVAEDGRGVGVLDGPIVVEELERGEADAAPRRERVEAGALRGIVERRVGGLGVHHLEAARAEPGREPLEQQAHVDQQVVVAARLERAVRPVHHVELEAERGERAPHGQRLPVVGVAVRDGSTGREQERIDDVREDRPPARRIDGGGHPDHLLVDPAQLAELALERARGAAREAAEPHGSRATLSC